MLDLPPRSDRLASDMAALGFEEIPQLSAQAAEHFGNRDFQRNGVLIRFWGWSEQSDWVHIEYEPDVRSGGMREVCNNGHGHGVASLVLYLKKGAREV